MLCTKSDTFNYYVILPTSLYIDSRDVLALYTRACWQDACKYVGRKLKTRFTSDQKHLKCAKKQNTTLKNRWAMSRTRSQELS